MQEEKYVELEDRAAQTSESDLFRQLEARARVHHVIEAMKAEGKALTLSDEEMQMLQSFRRFKVRMRQTAATFTWQTRRPEGVQIVEETAEIVHPRETAR